MSGLATGVGPADTTAEPPPREAALRIMIVEDSPGDARLAMEMLHERDPALLITTFASIDDATRALAGSNVDCVLLDLGLPDADGLEGLKRILAVAPGVPIVMLTGVENDRLALAAVAAGAQDYVTKRELAVGPLWRAINRAIERARLTGELGRRATHDQLTGLPNRALFEERVDHAIARSRRWATGFTIVFLDVDGFKAINDNFGHATGDDALREISRRLARGLRVGDTPCRYAGDEFAALCETARRPIEAGRLARRIHESICHTPVIAGVRSLNVSVSIGVTLGSGEDDQATLLRRVDRAMYEAKLTGAGYVLD